MKKLFDNFDKTYLINLKNRPDRLKSFQEEVTKYDLGNYDVFTAINGKEIKNKPNSVLSDGEIGVILSNIEILKDAKEKKYKKILIVEDDCYFTDEVKKIHDYMKFLPNEWDMLYFGGNHNTHVGVGPPTIINEKVIKLHHTYAAHFVVIDSKMFDEILFLLSMFNKQLDVVYSDLQKKYNVYSFYPAIAKQKEGFSDIQNANVDYNWLIK